MTWLHFLLLQMSASWPERSRLSGVAWGVRANLDPKPRCQETSSCALATVLLNPRLL